MEKKVKSRYGWRYEGVSLDPVSKTVPDQSLSVEDILRRFTQGVLTHEEIDRNHAYGEDIAPDEDFDNLDPQYSSDYDLVDAYEEAQQESRLRAELTASARRRGQGRKKAAPDTPPESSGEAEDDSGQSDSEQP